MEKRMISTFKMLSVIAALAATPTWAAAPDEHAGHHPAGAAAAVSAAPPPKTGEAPAAMPSGSMKGRRMMHMAAMSCVAMPAERLAALKSDLVLTPAQLPHWNAFADATQAMGQGMGMMHGSRMAKDMPMQPGTAMRKGMPTQPSDQGAMRGQTGSLLERLDRHEAMLIAHLDGVRKVKAALTPLTAALTPAQTAKFDAATTCPPKHP
jgi:hypothetical protein